MMYAAFFGLGQSSRHLSSTKNADAWQRPNHIDFCKRVGRRSPCCRAQSKAVGPWDRVSQLNRPYENGTIWPTRIDTVGDQMLQGMTDRLASGGC